MRTPQTMWTMWTMWTRHRDGAGKRLARFSLVLGLVAGLALWSGASAAHADPAEGGCTPVTLSAANPFYSAFSAGATARVANPTSAVTGAIDASGCDFGVFFGAGSSGTLSAAAVSNATYAGVFIDAGAGQVTINSSTMEHNGLPTFWSGVDFFGTSLSMNGDSANNNGGHGAYLRGSTPSAHVSITDSDLSSNPGLGIINIGGTTTIAGSTLNHNAAGGLQNQGGTVTISTSTFAYNSASGHPSAAGLDNIDGTVTISTSTFAYNSATGGGFGGLYNRNGGGTLTISNSTFANNSASGSGSIGGLVNGSGSTMRISTSTIANNVASGGGLGGLGNFDGTLTITQSIVAHNSGQNCHNITSQGYNLSSDSTCSFTGTGDQQNIDPQVASSLADNGGPTQTIGLLSSSPAINADSSGSCGGTDQRGAARPQGAACDIGAFEYRLPSLSLPTTITVDATNPTGSAVQYSTTAVDLDNGAAALTLTCAPTSGSTFPIGTTTVNCSASNAAGTSTGSFAVTVRGASDQLSAQITAVDGMGLDHGPQTSFDSQLSAVQTDLAAGNTAQACSDLASFVSHVTAQSGKQLTAAQANQLLAAAQRIQTVIGC